MAKDSINSQQQAFDQKQKVLRATRDYKKRGEIAELAFLHKAATLGFSVSRPYGDSDRYDFIVHSGSHFWRVQVKSTSCMFNGAYLVNARKDADGGKAAYTADEIDFLVVHIVPDDDWVVIPVQAFVPRKSVRVYPLGSERAWRYEKYREAWWLME